MATDATEVLRLWDVINNANEVLDNAIAEAGQEAVLEELFRRAFALAPGCRAASIIGYTPSFNDGDPCEHSQIVFVGAKSQYNGRTYWDWTDENGNAFNAAIFAAEMTPREPDEDDDEDDTFDPDVDLEHIDFGDEDEQLRIARCVNDNVSKRDLQKVKDYLDAAEELIHKMLYTNFLVAAKLDEEGNITIETDDYESDW